MNTGIDDDMLDDPFKPESAAPMWMLWGQIGILAVVFGLLIVSVVAR